MPVSVPPSAKGQQPAPRTARPWTFGLGSLLAVMVVFGAALALWMRATAAGILFSMVALTALLRTVGMVAQRRQAGLPASLLRRAGMFAVSFVLVAAVCATTLAALMVTRLLVGHLLGALGFRDAAELAGGLAGIAAAAATFTCALLWVLPTEK